MCDCGGTTTPPPLISHPTMGLQRAHCTSYSAACAAWSNAISLLPGLMGFEQTTDHMVSNIEGTVRMCVTSTRAQKRRKSRPERRRDVHAAFQPVFHTLVERAIYIVSIENHYTGCTTCTTCTAVCCSSLRLFELPAADSFRCVGRREQRCSGAATDKDGSGASPRRHNQL